MTCLAPLPGAEYWRSVVDSGTTPSASERGGSWTPCLRVSRGRRSPLERQPDRRHQREEASMDMNEYDRKTFVADSAKAFAERRITKREFLRRLGIAGLGL